MSSFKVIAAGPIGRTWDVYDELASPDDLSQYHETNRLDQMMHCHKMDIL